MRPLPNSARSDSPGETSSEAGDITAAFTGKDYYQELIDKANTVSLAKVLRHYNVRVDTYTRKVTCPFKSHKGGRENTPSFYFYPDTNSFKCYGCGIGGLHAHACEFVAAMDHITKVQAAYKVLELFEMDVGEETIYNQEDWSERLEIMMDFSNTVREFYQTFPGEDARVYVEGACATFDDMNLGTKLDSNEALRRAVEVTKQYLKNYKP